MVLKINGLFPEPHDLFLHVIHQLKDRDQVIMNGAFEFSDMENCRDRMYLSGTYAGSSFQKVIDATNGIALSACTGGFS